MGLKEKEIKNLLEECKRGFVVIPVDTSIKNAVLQNLKHWLTDSSFAAYKDQILFLITNRKFQLLLDAFYQTIPFGTGGRRGPVGIGPNRINPYTIAASAQGHSEYLLQKFGANAKTRGVVLAYDVRKYPETGIYHPHLKNPVRGITSQDFANIAAEIYAANGIRVYFFEDIRTTPELSFAVRFLKAVAGDVFSASHNPMTDNGKKVYAEHGGQLIPPEDQRLADMVNGVTTIKTMPFVKAKKQGMITLIGKDVDEAYWRAARRQSRSSLRTATIVYSPLHGVGNNSTGEVLRQEGFKVVLDPKTKEPDGFFPNVTFNIPNPEVPESMETLVKMGRQCKADIAVCTDPDADRIGLMVNHHSQWVYLNGNEIAVLLIAYLAAKGSRNGMFVKTCVTSELAASIARRAGLQVKGELMVGFKYIAEEIRMLEAKGRETDFVMGAEESHGVLIGTYTRDKDAAPASLLLSELASELKEKKQTLIDFLEERYREYGYHKNELNALIFEGAQGKAVMDGIQESLRKTPPQQFGTFKILQFVDHWNDAPFMSDTDKMSRNVLQWQLAPPRGIALIKLTIRPSGTEPKTKLYIEVGAPALGSKATVAQLASQKALVHTTLREAMDAFVLHAYKLAGITMPKRGLRLSWLLPVEIKLKYFAVERKLLDLKKQRDAKKISPAIFRTKAEELLLIFGKDPLEKINGAFVEKTGISLRKFLGC
ncbi:phospho-sugar mutase [Candidatus Woesearchaeota archaeon]|nr:phospho-sugar mutase [Candidatus Woesearchaeota archaeon]